MLQYQTMKIRLLLIKTSATSYTCVLFVLSEKTEPCLHAINLLRKLSVTFTQCLLLIKL